MDSDLTPEFDVDQTIFDLWLQVPVSIELSVIVY